MNKITITMKKRNIFTHKTTLILLAIVCFFGREIQAQGPNAPEAASFEPVDATDMVNLVTGDLSYVLPLLNVPSPEGGYPIALSYHAGVAMNQEASWVGLGWNINPGAINRSLNGYPDDWNNGKKIDLIYSDLGEQESFKIGLGINYKIFTLGASYTFVNGKAFGGDVSFGIKNISETSVGFGGYKGNITAGINYKNLKIGHVNGKLSIGVNYQGASVKLTENGRISVNVKLGDKFGNVGVSLSSSGFSIGHDNGYSLNVGSSNSFKNNVSSTGYAISAWIPIKALSLKLSYSKQKYWVFNSTINSISGGLYPDAAFPIGDEVFKDNAKKNKYMDIAFINDSKDEDTFSPSIFNKDSFNVSAQGLITNINYGIFEYNTLIGPWNEFDKAYGTSGETRIQSTSSYYSSSKFNKSKTYDDIHFYDNNVISSYLNVSHSELNMPDVVSKITDINAIGTLDNTLNINGKAYSYYNENKKRKGSQNFIEAYTNEQIYNGINGFKEAENYTRFKDNQFTTPKEGIGAYKITTPDGKTYHYSLPVYHYETITKIYDPEEGEDKSFFQRGLYTPYATHWLLTGITGPDYVDYNNNNRLDSSDYGYWVKFNYGKWTDGFVWEKGPFKDFLKTTTLSERAPTSRNSSVDRIYNPENKVKEQEIKTFGVKELYYLNSISTRTHTALFFKSIRRDNKGKTIEYNKSFDNVEKSLMNNVPGLATGVYFEDIDFEEQVKLTEVNSLKLDKVILINNKDSQSFVINHSVIPNEFTNENYIKLLTNSNRFDVTGRRISNFNYDIHNRSFINGHYENNVLLSKNYSDINIRDKSLKSIHFNFNYDLSKKHGDDFGKLSLNSISQKGKNFNQIFPDYEFKYSSPNYIYRKENFDNWGYDKSIPYSWSLNEVTFPTGSKLEIEYERDDFDEILFDGNKREIEDIVPKPIKIERLKNGMEGKITVRWNHPCYSIQEAFSCIENGTVIDIKFQYDIYNENRCNGRKRDDCSNSLTIRKEFITSATIIDIVNNVYHVNFHNAIPEILDGSLTKEQREQRQLLKIADIIIDGCNTNQLLGKCNDSRGGLRVKDIIVTNDDFTQNSIGYTYTKPNSNISSGITSQTPYLGVPDLKSIIPASRVMYKYVTTDDGIEKKKYTFNVFEPITSKIKKYKPIPHFLASPNSERRTILRTDQSNDYLNKIDNFFSFSASTVFNSVRIENNDDELNAVYYNNATIKDNFSLLGTLNSVVVYNKLNQIIRLQKNNYDFSFYDKVGTTSESFNSYRANRFYRNIARNINIKKDYHINTITSYKSPAILKRTEVTQGNFSVTEYFDKYDFLTGQVLETRTFASDGVAFKTKVVPAYTKYVEMGSKVDNESYVNMLTQQAANITYIYKNNDWKPIGANITTWNNDWEYLDFRGNIEETSTGEPGVWRKYETFVWKGDTDSNGIYTSFTGDEDNFKWGIGQAQTDADWQQVSEITKYDHYSMALESKDINGNYVATKMGDDNSKVIAVSNAKYTEMYYSGAEYLHPKDFDYLDGEIKATGRNIEKWHTGKYSIKVTPGEQGFQIYSSKEVHQKGRFKLSVWVHKDNHLNARVFNGGRLENFNGEVLKAGDWYLKHHYLDIQNIIDVSVTSNSGTVYYDDFRLHPIASSMTSYVYNEFDELTFIIGANGLATCFFYDAAGRLDETYVEVQDLVENPTEDTDKGGFKRVSKNTYNYKN